MGDAKKAARGFALRERAQGAKAEQLQEALRSLDPELAEWADEFIFGTVWSRDGLAFGERAIVAMVCLALGGHTEQLRNYMHGALQDGMPPQKIQEAMVMLCVYDGFPTALKALATYRDVLRARGVEL